MESTDGYEGVTHAGIAVIAQDTGRVFLAQRAMDDTDDESVQETWEFPGGSLEDGEEPLAGALREFSEEIGIELPEGEVVNGWRGGDNPETGHYQGFVYRIDTEFEVDVFAANDEVQGVGWFDSDSVQNLENAGELRPEIVATMDWSLVFPETVTNEEPQMATQVGTAENYEQVDAEEDLTEPEYDALDFAVGPIPIHGVIAPEDTPSGDRRGFSKGAMTTRPLRIPFRHQPIDVGAHDGSYVVGSVDRTMRKDGLIHWEGMLMPSKMSSELIDLIEFFDNRYGVSVDGDQGRLDRARSERTGETWFEQVRAAGLTAVAIPAFSEAYVALGPHPEMPVDEEAIETMTASGDLAGGLSFRRGAGWVTNPKETSRLHRYWTKGEGAKKIRWGTRGDWTRAKALIGEKIAKNSPDKMRFLNQIISQWHFDALGYWPGELDRPGNKTSAEARAERRATNIGIEMDSEGTGWESVLVSSAGVRAKPPIEYFHRHPNTGNVTIEEPDENGLRRTYGRAALWGVCHVGMSGRCVEPPRTYSDDYKDFHLGRTGVEGGFIPTGVLTYGVGHRDADTILSESADQAFFDNINNAWAAVRVGEDEDGIWFSGVVLPGVPEEHLIKIAASGQVSGEWLRGEMRACLTVNVPGFPVEQPSVTYDNEGNVLALAASAFGQSPDSPCEPTPAELMRAIATVDAELRFAAMKEKWVGTHGV